jgi:hypothetical protein
MPARHNLFDVRYEYSNSYLIKVHLIPHSQDSSTLKKLKFEIRVLTILEHDQALGCFGFPSPQTKT